MLLHVSVMHSISLQSSLYFICKLWYIYILHIYTHYIYIVHMCMWYYSLVIYYSVNGYLVVPV